MLRILKISVFLFFALRGFIGYDPRHIQAKYEICVSRFVEIMPLQIFGELMLLFHYDYKVFF